MPPVFGGPDDAGPALGQLWAAQGHFPRRPFGVGSPVAGNRHSRTPGRSCPERKADCNSRRDNAGSPVAGAATPAVAARSGSARPLGELGHDRDQVPRP